MSELLQVTQLSSCSCSCCLFTLPPSVDYPCSSLWGCTWAACCCCLHADKLAGAPGSLRFGGYRPRRARERENLQRKHFFCFCRLLTESAPHDMELKSACRMFLFPVQMLYYLVRASLASLLPSRRKDLSREVVLITGGGRGIGRHLAKEFAKQGSRKVKKENKKIHFTPANLLHPHRSLLTFPVI